jgi:broad specificity phosphatase PhoE
MRRLLLVRHASTDAVRAAAFGTDEPLDAGGRAAAARLRLPRADEVLVSPALRTRETASAAGLVVSGEDAALAECDFGRWAGLTLREVAEREPDAVTAWLSDPDAAPYGGESLSQVLGRVRDWLARQAAQDGTAVVITHAGVVKAAVVTALDAPPAAFWRIDVAPLSVTELHAHDDRWTVTRVNDRGAVAPAGPPEAGDVAPAAVAGSAEVGR